jgi:hypothetical protein
MEDMSKITAQPLVIRSSLASDQHFNSWLDVNHYQTVQDVDEFCWKIKCVGSEYLDVESKLQHSMEIFVQNEFGAEQLPAISVDFDRLKEMVGAVKLIISLPVRKFATKNRQDLRAWMADQIIEVQELVSTKSYEQERHLKLAELVESNCLFGALTTSAVFAARHQRRQQEQLRPKLRKIR